MNRDDIIRMAREAGFEFNSLGGTYTSGKLDEHLERFAALVAAHERESVAASSKRDLTCVCGAVWDGEQMVHAPRKREWVGLTEIEICDIEADELTSASSETFSFARAIETKLKERNGG